MHNPRNYNARHAARCFVIFAACAFALLHSAVPAAAQTIVPADVPTTSPAPEPIPKTVSIVREIDATSLAKLLPRADAKAARPVLVNFWATWCEPCRVEFPDLVKIDNEFRPRGLDFFTVSLDDPAEIATTVPTFLSDMKALRIPAYLLNTPEPADAINLIDKTWSGALPATFLFNRHGELVYRHTGLIKHAELKAAIEKSLKDEGGRMK